MSVSQRPAVVVVGAVSDALVGFAAGQAPPRRLSAAEFERRLEAGETPPLPQRILISGATLARLAGARGFVERLVRGLCDESSLWVSELSEAGETVLRPLTRLRFTGTLPAPGRAPVHGFERKRLLLALTIDYETWHPLPPGYTIDWERDVFEPARRFARLAEGAGGRATFFVEMGEYFFLRRFDPEVGARMEEQWRQLVSAGHDLQLHLHPDWLPELGARHDEHGWAWDARFVHAHDYPGDLAETLARCRSALETAASTPRHPYTPSVYRAGAYRAQPFGRLSLALRASGITCDSSVFRGGVSAERGYDYSHAFSAHQPYLCSPFDPQLRAVPEEAGILELPIATPGFGRRWSLDGADQRVFAAALLGLLEAHAAGTRARARYPGLWQARERASRVLHRLSRGRVAPLPRLPQDFPPGELRHGHEYFVAIGHTKGEHDFALLASQLERIRQATCPHWVTLRTMAEAARADLARADEWHAAVEAADRDSPWIPRTAPPAAQEIADVLARALPWAGSVVCVIGDRSGEVAALLAPQMPWKRFAHAAAAPEAVAATTPAGARLACAILAQGTPVPQAALRRWAADLGPEGRLLVPVAFDPDRMAYTHLPGARAALLREWRFRLADAGLQSWDLAGANRGGIAGVLAAAAAGPPAPVEYFRGVMDWLYAAVEPDDGPDPESDPRRVLTRGRALCLGYSAALGAILARDGFAVEYVTLLARDHERGRPPHRTDSHEVLQVVDLATGAMLLDPTANVVIPCPLLPVLRNPSLAGAKPQPDARYRARRYDLYSTSYFYERTYEALVRSSPDVIAYDAQGSWRARAKLLLDFGRRRVYRRRGGAWSRVLLPLDPRGGRPTLI